MQMQKILPSFSYTIDFSDLLSIDKNTISRGRCLMKPSYSRRERDTDEAKKEVMEEEEEEDGT